MITEEQAMKLLTESNPVPDLSVLDLNGSLPITRLVDIETRSSEMTDLKTKNHQTTRDRNRRRLMVGAVAAAVVVVIAALVLSQPGEEAPVVDEPPVVTQATEPATPAASEVATAFVEAYGNFDADSAVSYLAADADIVELGVDTGSLDDFRLTLSLLEAEGYSHVLDACEERSSSDFGTTVRCTVDFHDLRSDEMGLGPYSGTYFDLIVLDGEIIRAMKHWGIAEFSPQMWSPFEAWVAANHPEDWVPMGLDDNGDRLNETSILLWEQRTKEYVGVKAAEVAAAFLDAYWAFDLDAAFSYLSEDATGFGSEPAQRLEAGYHQAVGSKRISGPCEVSVTGREGTTVLCSFDYHMLRSDEIGLGPYSAADQVTVRDVKVISVEDVSQIPKGSEGDPFSKEVWEPFRAWVAQNHPEDVAVMYDGNGWRITEESIPLWEQRTREYVEAVSQN